jgi:hypothetical protein
VLGIRDVEDEEVRRSGMERKRRSQLPSLAWAAHDAGRLAPTQAGRGAPGLHVAAGLGGHTLEDRSAIRAASGRRRAMSAVGRRGFGEG